MQKSFDIIRGYVLGGVLNLSVFQKYVIRWRLQVKHEAADVIRTFFKEVHDTSKLMKVVKKYRYAGGIDTL